MLNAGQNFIRVQPVTITITILISVIGMPAFSILLAFRPCATGIARTEIGRRYSPLNAIVVMNQYGTGFRFISAVKLKTMGTIMAAAVRTVRQFGENTRKYDQNDDRHQASVERHTGDEFSDALTCARAVQQRAQSHTAGKENHHTPHRIFLRLFPCE